MGGDGHGSVHGVGADVGYVAALLHDQRLAHPNPGFHVEQLQVPVVRSDEQLRKCFNLI